jgi:hypothetical protein
VFLHEGIIARGTRAPTLVQRSEDLVLTAAALGLAGYGTFEVIIALTHIVNGPQIEWWALLLLVVFGTMLVVAAAFVRVKLPGGLALAISALLALQALAIHGAVHEYGEVILPFQLARGGVAVLLVALAYLGSRKPA